MEADAELTDQVGNSRHIFACFKLSEKARVPDFGDGAEILDGGSLLIHCRPHCRRR